MGKAKRPLPKMLPRKLKIVRQSLDLSMEKLVARLGEELRSLGYSEVNLYTGYIAEYESGKREPVLPVLLAYSILSRQSINDLVDHRIEVHI